LGAVDIGGLPHDYRSIAPDAVVDSLATDFVHLIREVAPLLGHLSLIDVAVEHLSGSTHRVSATIENTGRIPTLSASATGARLFAPARAELATPSGVTLIDSRASVRLGTLDAGERRRVEWLLKCPEGARVTVRAHSTRAGHDAVTVEIDALPEAAGDTGADADTTAAPMPLPDPDAPGPIDPDSGPKGDAR
jgi:hypothetical protein